MTSKGLSDVQSIPQPVPSLCPLIMDRFPFFFKSYLKYLANFLTFSSEMIPFLSQPSPNGTRSIFNSSVSHDQETRPACPCFPEVIFSPLTCPLIFFHLIMLPSLFPCYRNLPTLRKLLLPSSMHESQLLVIYSVIFL